MRKLIELEMALVLAAIVTFGGISTFLGNELLDHVFKTGAYTQPTGIHVSLHTADPGLTGASEIPSTNGYVRANMDVWDVAATLATENTNAITFPTATGSNWTAATYFGIWDASTAGNFLGGAALDTSRTVTVGDTAEFAVGALDVTMA